MLKQEVEEKMRVLEQEILGRVGENYLDKVNEDLCTAPTMVGRCQVLKGVMLDFIIEDADEYVCELYSLEETMDHIKENLALMKRIDEIWGACDVITDNPMEGDFAAHEYQV